MYKPLNSKSNANLYQNDSNNKNMVELKLLNTIYLEFSNNNLDEHSFRNGFKDFLNIFIKKLTKEEFEQTTGI